MNFLIKGMRGMGDNIYQRPYVKALAAENQVWLETPWPELYADIPNVHCAKPHTTLRTQLKNIYRQKIWESPPGNVKVKTVSYDVARRPIWHGMAESFGVAPLPWDMPDFGPCPVVTEKPVALLRPATIRAEWRADSRNPAPENLLDAANVLRGRGFHVVSVADLDGAREWLVGEVPPADTVFHSGELTFPVLMALVQHASVIVGGVGWIVPAALAFERDLFVIFGGQGGHNAPSKIIPEGYDVGLALPDRFCMCRDAKHRCDKRITNFKERFEQWVSSKNW